MGLHLRALIFFLCLAPAASATHIIGGEMFYDHLGGDQYQVTLELYRDCGPSNTLGTGFDVSAPIGVFNAANVFLFSVTFFDTGESTVPVVINNPCLMAPPEVCVATTIYTGTVTLPPIAGGYHLAYQRCCRTPALVNLSIPNEQGVTCTVKVPGTPNANNSSPRFDEYPPVVLCMGVNLVIDHSATDPDADELIYELCAPFQGASNMDPAPVIPTPPPYTPVMYGAGYSFADPLDADPALAIDPVTGILTVTPTLIGSFAVGVRVREMRNGVQLSEVIRDFKFDVVSCATDIVAGIEEMPPEELFECLTASFQNSSLNGEFWFWDFGDGNTLADTSVQSDPQWTYAQSGTYTVTLIANPGWPCADTTQITIETPPAFGAYFEPEEGLCMDQVYDLPALGDLPDGLIYAWTIPPTAIATSLDGPVLSASFSTPGVHVVSLSVSLLECNETYTDSVSVFPLPEADFTNENFVCVGEAILFEDLSIAMTALAYEWDLGDGNVSTDEAPSHVYEEPGTYTVTLNITTLEGCVMEDSLTRVNAVTVYPLPVPGFRIMPSVVSVVNPEVEILDHAEEAVSWSYLVEGATVYEPSFTQWFDGAGHVTVWQTVTSEHGCSASTSVDVFITDHLFFAPNAFTPNGDDVNDTFAPVVKGARLYELMIFDRYGAQLFHTQDPQAEWSGDDLPPGVYTYFVRIAEFGTHRQEYKGHVTLVR